jgi:hypothetical protein
MGKAIMKKIKRIIFPSLSLIVYLSFFNLSIVHAENISGHVYESDGTTPIANVVVQAFSACGGSYINSVYVSSAGAYNLWVPSSGTYYLFACTTSMCGFMDLPYVNEWYGGSVDCAGSTPVTVVTGVITENIDFQLDDSGTVSGIVTEIDGTTPIAYASVVAYSDACGGTELRSAMTPTSGQYTITGLPEGNVYIKAGQNSGGYISEWYEDAVDCSDGDPVAVTAGGTTEVNFQLVQTGSISGKVFESDGVTFINDVLVTVYSAPWNGPRVPLGSAITEISGDYIINGIPEGNVYVRATVNWGNYVSEWYVSAIEVADADMVVVTGGLNIGDINFQLDEGQYIEGYVLEEDGLTPLKGVVVNAYTQLEKCRTSPLTAGSDITDEDGYYIIEGLPEGHVYAQACGSSISETLPDVWYTGEFGNESLNCEDAVPVDYNDSVYFTLPVLANHGSISGTVYELDGITPIAGVEVRAYLEICGYYFLGSAITDTSGQYTIYDLPDYLPDYPAYVYASDSVYNTYQAEWYNALGGTTSCHDADPVSVTEGQDTGNIDFQLERNPGWIQGLVFESDGTTPIPSIIVEVYDGENNSLGIGFTNEYGYYEITGLPEGEVYIKAGPFPLDRRNFISEWWYNKYDFETADPVTITSGAATGIDFLLDQGGAISGIVYDSDGTTHMYNSIDIEVYSDSCFGNKLYSTKTEGAGLGYGSYVIHGIPPGVYYIKACASCSGLSYEDQWYENSSVSECMGANSVLVALGQETADIDFRLTMEGTGAISGHVYEIDGRTPIPDIRVDVYDSENNLIIAGVTNEDGEYTITGLTEGNVYLKTLNWNLDFRDYVDEWYPDNIYRIDADPVAVTIGEVTDADFILRKGGAISGNVFRSDGTTPIDRVLVEVYFNPCGGNIMKSDYTDPYGYYEIRGVPAGLINYVKACYSCSGLDYEDQWYNAASECSDADQAAVFPGEITRNIDFQLQEQETASISGTVYQSDGVTPIENALVEAYSDQCGNNLDSAITNAAGQYEIYGLPEGSVYLEVVTGFMTYDYITTWYVDAHRCNKAVPVTVTDGVTADNIDFQLDHDNDSDGMGDEWEIAWFGSKEGGPLQDHDEDGLSDYYEYLFEADPNDTDSDNDGLGDGDEVNAYLTDPTLDDTDGDGYADGDEIFYGSSPILASDTPENHRPGQPVVQTEVADAALRSHVFNVPEYIDPDGDLLSSSEWQFGMDEYFAEDEIILHKVLENGNGIINEEGDMLLFTMMETLFLPNEVYWVRVRVEDDTGLWSPWSEPVMFTTVAEDPDDQDLNGIDDSYQVDGDTDLNDNGIVDSKEGILVLADAEGGDNVGVSSSKGVISALTSYSAEDLELPDGTALPEMPYGLFSYRIDGLSIGATVDLTFYFADTIPEDAEWYKYDSSDGTSFDYSSNIIDIDGNKAVVRITDGGTGDMDGVLNGVIIDPSGPSFHGEVTIDDIIKFFNDSVNAGGINGKGATSLISKASLLAMKTLLLTAKSLMEHGYDQLACFTLNRSYLRSDGMPTPLADFVVGEAVPELNRMINDLMDQLCSGG